MNVSAIRNRYKTGDYAVYPLLLQSSTHPEAGKIKIVSGRKSGKWMETDHYGTSPLNSWEDVFSFLEEEVDKLKRLNALSYISRDEVRVFWEEINPPPVVVNAPDPNDVDNLVVSTEGISSLYQYIDNGEDDLRFNPGYFESILLAWENAFKKLKKDYESGILAPIN